MRWLGVLALGILVGSFLQGAWDAKHLCGPLTPLQEHLRIDTGLAKIDVAQGILNHDRARQEQTYALVARVLARRRR